MTCLVEYKIGFQTFVPSNSLLVGSSGFVSPYHPSSIFSGLSLSSLVIRYQAVLCQDHDSIGHNCIMFKNFLFLHTLAWNFLQCLLFQFTVLLHNHYFYILDSHPTPSKYKLSSFYYLAISSFSKSGVCNLDKFKTCGLELSSCKTFFLK